MADPPLISPVTAAEYDQIAQGLDDYVHTLPPHWRRVFAGYTLVDIALKVVGIGSVGLRAYIALLEGSADDVLFLQLKEARRSVVAPFVHGGRAWHEHQGQRVVEYQQAVQTVSDPLLGWTTIDGLQYYVRQFRNMKGQVPLNALRATALSDYAGITGHLLAKGHARTSGASLIAGHLGADDEENDPGVRCVAAPIRDQSGRVAYAISVSTLSLEHTMAALEAMAPNVIEATGRISAALSNANR